MNSNKGIVILGGGVTGLAAGYASGLPVFEAVSSPGGICSSYYRRPNETARLSTAPADDEAYRFEIGGGHWIFGGDPVILRFIANLAPGVRYARKSSVYFPDTKLFVPYPVQNNLRFLKQEIIDRIMTEIEAPKKEFRTMRDWLTVNFGATLGELFFYPFHVLYTSGLDTAIAPQDPYKSPVNIEQVKRGALQSTAEAGYNVTFFYPREGLNALAQRMAHQCDIRYNKKVISINIDKKEIFFEDGEQLSYNRILSTLPLNKMIDMTGICLDEQASPYTSVLVLNIGATRGKKCPSDHWLYIPRSDAGFHRIGFYSNVDVSFLPASSRESNDRVSIYIERAYANGLRPSQKQIDAYVQDVIRELQDWQFIEKAEVTDPTWIDVAYTWSYPNSGWKEKAVAALQGADIYQIGRYGRWIFQGIADSIRDGFYAGTAFRNNQANVLKEFEAVEQ